MDEPSPWGAPSDSPPLARAPSPKLRYSPPAASGSFSAPAWDDSGDGGWGGAVDDYVPGAFGGGFSAGDEEIKPSERDDEGEVSAATLGGAAGGWGGESPELPRLDAREPAGNADEVDLSASTRFGTSPPLPPVALPLPSFPSDSLDDSAAPNDPGAPAEDDRGGGWGGAEPDLPPIGALRVADPASPTEDEPRVGGWGGADEELVEEEEEPPLPSVGDLFPSAKSRRGSVELAQQAEQGGDAWGSSQGWEERMRIEAEAREKQRIAEAKAAGLEPEQERKPDATTGGDAQSTAAAPAEGDTPAPKVGLSSIFRFRKSAEDTAARAAETVKDTTASAARGAAALARSASSRPSSEQDPAAAMGASGEKPAAQSWLSRVAARQGDPSKAAMEDDDPNSLGIEEIQQGDSGRTVSPEPQQGSAIGRLFSRLKRPASAPTDGPQQSTSARNSSEQAPPDLRVADLDALGDPGLVSRLQAQAQAKKDMYDYDEDEEDEKPPPSGFFGKRSKSTSRVPDAPPEDDFGGLLGAFSVAPTAATIKPKASSSSFDPFDPLSDSFGTLAASQAELAVRSAAAPALARPPPPPVASSSRLTATVSVPASLHPSAQVATFGGAHSSKPPARASSPMDDFDAFFDSVAISTGNKAVPRPAAPPSVLSPTPRTRPPPPATIPAPMPRTATSQARARVVSPPPRVTISPPVRMATASPASSATGRTTPIMPLAPPPPPSQPLAASRLIGLDAPPPTAPSQRIPSASIAAPPLAPAPALSPALSASSKGKTPSPQPQPQRTASGPLSMDDLSFFES